MNKELSESLLDFYQKILAPEFESIKKKQASHDGKFIDILGHFPRQDMESKLKELKMQFFQMQSRLEAIEQKIASKGSGS